MPKPSQFKTACKDDSGNVAQPETQKNKKNDIICQNIDWWWCADK